MLTLTLVLLSLVGTNCFLWGSKTTYSPPPSTTTPHPVAVTIRACAARQCYLKFNRMFSCPLSGCVNISNEIPRDIHTIKLQDNNITAIPELFYPQLNLLDLANNKISSIDMYAFKNLTNLQALYLSNNRITTLYSAFFRDLIKLEYLHLSGNKLTTIDSNIFYPYLPSLVTLDLGYNQIAFIEHDAFSDAVSLKVLTLTGNNLTSVKRIHLMNLPRLHELYLNQNDIRQLDIDTFFDLPNLQILNLSFNKIKIIQNGTFVLQLGESRLEMLDLRNNDIKDLTLETFQGLESLKTLHLDYNPFIEIPPDVFPPSLQKLCLNNLADLRIVHEGAFRSLNKLQTLSLANNRRLTSIQAGAFDPNLKDLFMLDLSKNNLKTLQQEILSDWNEVESVDLSRNPWRCDCNIVWMREVYMAPADRHAIRCHSPRRLAGKSMTDLRSKDLDCGGAIFSFRQRAGVTLIILLSAAFVFLLGLFTYRCRENVFPCWYGKTGDYRALYNVSDPDDAVLRISVSDTDKKVLKAQDRQTVLPEPVAL